MIQAVKATHHMEQNCSPNQSEILVSTNQREEGIIDRRYGYPLPLYASRNRGHLHTEHTRKLGEDGNGTGTPSNEKDEELYQESEGGYSESDEVNVDDYNGHPSTWPEKKSKSSSAVTKSSVNASAFPVAAVTASAAATATAIPTATPAEDAAADGTTEKPERGSLFRKISQTFAENTNRQDLHGQSMAENTKAAEIWENAELYDEHVEQMFTYVQVFTACLNAFAHGANDVANVIAPISAVITILQNG